MATKKKAEDSAQEPEAQQWTTLKESAEAARAREEDGVLVSFEPTTTKDAHSRHYQLGIVAVRMVSHDGEEMVRIKRDAKRAAIQAHNEGRKPADHIQYAESLPPELQRQWECEVAVASLRGGNGVELHGDFECSPEATSEEIQALFRDKLDDAPNWIVSGLHLMGSKIVGDEKLVTDRQILDARGKGSACQRGRELDSAAGGRTAGPGGPGAVISRLAALGIGG